MALQKHLYPINAAQISDALTTYSANEHVKAGLQALKAVLTDTTIYPYKCNMCAGAGIDTSKTHTDPKSGIIVKTICPACDGNGRLKSPVKLKITKSIA